jgi:hypothetical protein
LHRQIPDPERQIAADVVMIRGGVAVAIYTERVADARARLAEIEAAIATKTAEAQQATEDVAALHVRYRQTQTDEINGVERWPRRSSGGTTRTSSNSPSWASSRRRSGSSLRSCTCSIANRPVMPHPDYPAAPLVGDVSLGPDLTDVLYELRGGSEDVAAPFMRGLAGGS